MRPPTIRDVAREAGVGIGTVSRVLNNSHQVTPETRERVLNAIQMLGFKPNPVARQLPRKTRVRNVGVVLPFLTDHSFVERLRGVQLALQSNSNTYELILYNISAPDHYDDLLTSIVQQGLVEGVVIFSLNLDSDQQTRLDDAGIAYVGTSDHCPNSYPCVGIDSVAGGFLVTKHLLELGHKRIAYIGDTFPSPYGFMTSIDRYAGYEQALAAHDIALNADYVRLGGYGRDAAQVLTTELLNRPEPPTAIFAMSDIQAMGCMAAIREAGWRVPDDISVAGYDDIEISRYLGLTTVRQHLEASGQLAMNYLLFLLDDPGSEPTLTLPAQELVVRDTTAPPRSS